MLRTVSWGWVVHYQGLLHISVPALIDPCVDGKESLVTFWCLLNNSMYILYGKKASGNLICMGTNSIIMCFIITELVKKKVSLQLKDCLNWFNWTETGLNWWLILPRCVGILVKKKKNYFCHSAFAGFCGTFCHFHNVNPVEASASKQAQISHISFSVVLNNWPPFSMLWMLNTWTFW